MMQEYLLPIIMSASFLSVNTLNDVEERSLSWYIKQEFRELSDGIVRKIMRFFKSKEEKELDNIISRLEMNMSNNYKDNAQDNLKELEAAINALSHSGKMKPAILDEYMAILNDYKEKMKGYSHKDQKPYWH